MKKTSPEIAMLGNSVMMASRVIGGRCGVGAPTVTEMSAFIGVLLHNKQFILGLIVDCVAAGLWYFLNWKWALSTIVMFIIAYAVRNVRAALKSSQQRRFLFC